MVETLMNQAIASMIKNARDVFHMMAELNQRIGTALVMVTHDTSLVRKMDKRYHLEQGTQAQT